MGEAHLLVDYIVYNCVQLMEKERLVSSLRLRTDSESSAAKPHTEIALQEPERSVHDFSERALLIENLQRELSSAQVCL